MRLKAWSQLALAGLAGVLLASCAREAPPPPPRPSPPVLVPPPARPTGTAQYMSENASNSLLVVRASELAMERPASASTRELASRLKRDHTGIAAQLNMAGRRLNLLPSASMMMLHQVMLDGLSRASDFDSAYRRTMRTAVENCIATHGSYAEAGGSPTLRPVARFAASTCREELPLVRSR